MLRPTGDSPPTDHTQGPPKGFYIDFFSTTRYVFASQHDARISLSLILVPEVMDLVVETIVLPTDMSYPDAQHQTARYVIACSFYARPPMVCVDLTFRHKLISLQFHAVADIKLTWTKSSLKQVRFFSQILWFTLREKNR